MGVRAKYKYIQDPLYGMVYLSETEMRIVDSQAFQRLLSVKQLGYAYAVFPGADYSRFSHCVGTCYVMGRWLDELEKSGAPLDPATKVLYRLAALLHDVGHYPFSHATERAAEEYYDSLKQQSGHGGAGGTRQAEFENHERIGGTIIRTDPEIRDALLDVGVSAEALERVYRRHSVDSMASLLSSDLDADRLDFLRRTAYHAGLPYGNADFQYLVTQIRLDSNDRVCWTNKALSAIDHLLIARYFDYEQVVHNKTVVALELVLELLVREMLSSGILQLTKRDVERHVQRGTWIKIDDHYMFGKIRHLQNTRSSDATIVALCQALLSRNPPRMLYHVSLLGSYEDIATFERFAAMARLKVLEIANSLGMDRRLWFFFDNVFKFTKYRHGPINQHNQPSAHDLYEIPRVRDEAGESKPIIEVPLSLTRLFYTKRKFDFRVYLLFPELLPASGGNTAAGLLRRRGVAKLLSESLKGIFDATLGKIGFQEPPVVEVDDDDTQIPLL